MNEATPDPKEVEVLREISDRAQQRISQIVQRVQSEVPGGRDQVRPRPAEPVRGRGRDL